MTVSAYVLMQTEIAKAATVAKELASMDRVVSADEVTGPYDVIVRVEADSLDELGRMVVNKIQKVDGVTRTMTCPTLHL